MLADWPDKVWLVLSLGAGGCRRLHSCVHFWGPQPNRTGSLVSLSCPSLQVLTHVSCRARLVLPGHNRAGAARAPVGRTDGCGQTDHQPWHCSC